MHQKTGGPGALDLASHVLSSEQKRPMTELSARARQILYACITEFVSTGEPVGSRTLSKTHGIDLSAASIRNVLSDLEG